MGEEIRALEKDKIWEIVDLPKGKKPMGCVWVFTKKYKTNGTSEKYKARLVTKGYTQTYGGLSKKLCFNRKGECYTSNIVLNILILVGLYNSLMFRIKGLHGSTSKVQWLIQG